MKRQLQPEKMDQPGLDPHVHAQALAGLRRVNFLSATSWQFAGAIRRMCPNESLRDIRLMDIACGSGDVLLGTVGQLSSGKATVEAVGVDMSPFAVAQAQRLAVERKQTSVRFEVLDVLAGDLPLDYDIITSSLFLHHLDKPSVELLLAKMASSCRHGVIVSDLKRSRIGYLLAWLVARLISRSPVVHYDAPVSVQGAYTIAEIQAIAESVGMHGVQVRSCWPQRWMLSWSKAT